MRTNSLSGIASTKPSPSMLSEVRNVRTLSESKTCSWMAGSIARSLINEPPGWSVKLPALSTCPARSSLTWVADPETGFWWHSRQDWAL